MQATIELDTDDVDANELDELASQHKTCNGFAFSYLENSDNDVVVKDAFVDGSDGGAHCYVYDRDRDVTIDVTLRQFEVGPDLGAWDGDHHPHVAEFEEVFEWESREDFEEHYGAMPERDNPFYL